MVHFYIGLADPDRTGPLVGRPILRARAIEDESALGRPYAIQPLRNRRRLVSARVGHEVLSVKREHTFNGSLASIVEAVLETGHGQACAIGIAGRKGTPTRQ